MTADLRAQADSQGQIPMSMDDTDAKDSCDEFGTAELREGEQRDDSNIHARRNAEQLRLAREELEDNDE